MVLVPLQFAGMPSRTVMVGMAIVWVVLLILPVLAVYYLRRTTIALERITELGEQAAAEGESESG